MAEQARDNNGRWASEGSGGGGDSASQMHAQGRTRDGTHVSRLFSKKQRKELLDIVERHEYVARVKQAHHHAREAS